eukprot:COSAG01_NODE_8997_length_2588_cov_1.518682_5_plen_87_part_01
MPAGGARAAATHAALRQRMQCSSSVQCVQGVPRAAPCAAAAVLLCCAAWAPCCLSLSEPAAADRRGIGFGWLQNAWLLHARLKIHRG